MATLSRLASRTLKTTPIFVSNRGVIVKPILKKPNEKFKEAMLIIPIATFGLGTWQVYRWRWKLNLIKNMEEKMAADPIDLPQDLSNLEELEYSRVKVKGRFDHSAEMYLSPRSLVIKGQDPGQGQGLISAGNRSTIGLWVISPFQLSDRNGERILINRGWVPREIADPKKRQHGQVSDEVEIIGVVRKTEKRPPFGGKNNEASKEWQHRDLEAMSCKLGTLPIFIDADGTSTISGGPVGGQTRITLRNEHLSYIVTWYGLSILTSYMWYLKYIKKFPLLV